MSNDDTLTNVSMLPANGSVSRLIEPDGDGYPDEIRAAAFQFWAFRAGRKCEHLPVFLMELCAELGYKVPTPTTLRRWERAGDWEQRANTLIRDLAPAIDQHDATALFLQRGKAIQTVDDVFERRLPLRERMAALMAARLTYEATGVIRKDGTPGLAALTAPAQSQDDDIIDTESPEDRATRRTLDRLKRQRRESSP